MRLRRAQTFKIAWGCLVYTRQTWSPTQSTKAQKRRIIGE
jgi:hypothetical protein